MPGQRDSRPTPTSTNTYTNIPLPDGGDRDACGGGGEELRTSFFFFQKKTFSGQFSIEEDVDIYSLIPVMISVMIPVLLTLVSRITGT